MSTQTILEALQCAPQLSTSTFTRWFLIVESVLIGLDIDAHIHEYMSELYETSKPAKTPLLRQDRQIKVALASLVPDEIYHLASSQTTAKEVWDSIQSYYKPRCEGTLTNLLKDFWRFDMPDGTSVDKFAEELVRRQMRIASIDPSLQPKDDIMKGYLLDFFDTCCGGYFAGSVTVLRNYTTCSFAQTVQSLRLTQANYEAYKSRSSAVILSDNRGAGKPPAENYKSKNPHRGKTCGHCGRTNHIRETCFLWLKTQDGFEWAARNPYKAARTRKLFQKFGKRQGGDGSGGASMVGNLERAWIL